jgi:hypothetical protein
MRTPPRLRGRRSDSVRIYLEPTWGLGAIPYAGIRSKSRTNISSIRFRTKKSLLAEKGRSYLDQGGTTPLLRA